jgi:Flp pilus assembly protein TadG
MPGLVGRRPANPDNEAGAAMVEFAIIAPLFFMLVFGILTFGRGLHTQLELSTAAQEGARVMFVGGTEGEARDAAVAAAAITPALTTGEVSVTPASCTTGTELRVVAIRPVELSWIVASTTLTVSGRGVIRCP